MLKISILTNTFPPEFGAAPSRLFDMAKAFLNAGYDVDVLTGMPNYPSGKMSYYYRRKIFSKEILAGIPVRRHWIYPAYSDKKFTRFFSMLSLAVSLLISLPYVLKRKPDVIITQYPPIFSPITAYFFAKLTGAKFILNVSDIWPSAIFDLGLMSKNVLYKLLSCLEKKLYKSAVLCLGQSKEIVTHIQCLTHTEVMLFRTGVDCDFFKPRNYTSYHKKTTALVYAGVLGVAHGILAICQSIDFLALNAEFHIYGDGFEKDRIIAWIKQFPKLGIFYHGAIRSEHIPQTLIQYRAVLIAQKAKVYGTVPSKMYEAMALGMPILFSGSGEGADMVRQYQCGLVSEPTDFETLKENIRRLSGAGSKSLKAMGVNGRRLAVDKFDRKKQIKGLLDKFLIFEH